jgi:hypothetical protein
MIDNGREVDVLLNIVALVNSVDGSLESAESACIDARYQAEMRLLELDVVTFDAEDPTLHNCPGCNTDFEDFVPEDGCQCPNCKRTIRLIG